MNSRRTFFKKIYAAAAIIALAPQLAFGTVREDEKYFMCFVNGTTRRMRWTAVLDKDQIDPSALFTVKQMEETIISSWSSTA